MIKKTKRNREQDPDYVRFVHGFPCSVKGCSTPWPVHAHHAVPKSRLGSDRSCIPLCMNHHVGLYGIHKIGEATWKSKFFINLEEVIDDLNKKYEQKEQGPFADRIPSVNLRTS